MIDDQDNPEWTPEDFAKARPASEIGGPEVAARLVKTRPFDASRYINTPGARLSLLWDALRSGHPPYMLNAVRIVTRSLKRSHSEVETGQPPGSQ